MQDGDIVNVDVSPILNGVHSDLNDRAPTLTLTPTLARTLTLTQTLTPTLTPTPTPRPTLTLTLTPTLPLTRRALGPERDLLRG